MIFEHEIPKGSRLYFGKNAKQKRELEHAVSRILVNNGFEEIVTPNFSFSQHQSIEDQKKLISIADEDNNKLTLRADSTLDVVRIITKRLGRTTTHKKWFYIQPVFTYPANEQYQIGCEWIEHDEIEDILNLTGEILNSLKITPVLQLSNINIPRIAAKELNIDEELFKYGEIAALYDLKIDWLSKLIEVKDLEDVEDAIKLVPQSIKAELEKLKDCASTSNYANIVIAPLYYGSLKYYDDIYYRVIHNNLTLVKGGSYKSEGISSLGFALYTDNILKILED